MITKENYRTETRRITLLLPRGTKEIIRKEKKISYTVLDNVWYGNQYHEKAIAAINEQYVKLKKQINGK